MSEYNGVPVRKTVGAILVNERGEVLLQQRDEKPGLLYPGYWTFFGGAVEDGETIEAAIRRELWEELELELPLDYWVEYVCPVRTIEGEVVVRNNLFIGAMTQPLDALRLHEGQAMAYFDREAAAALTLAYDQSTVLMDYFAMKAAEND
jgi:8-oxo-dGTP pyrophosphatase MutT (NUDIX family)